MPGQNTGWNLKVEKGWIGRMLVAGLSLLLGLALAYATFDYAVPKLENGDRASARRFGWYLRSGQWRADVRTLGAAFQFLANSDPATPIPSNSITNEPVGCEGLLTHLAH